MYLYPIRFIIKEDQLAYVIVEADNRDDCIDKMVALFRDVWSKCTYWHGPGGMMAAILLAQKAGHTVYAGAGQSFGEYYHYVDSDKHTIVGWVDRFTHEGGDDFIDCSLDKSRVFGSDETDYCDGTLFDDDNGTPDFAALADLIDAAHGASCTE